MTPRHKIGIVVSGIAYILDKKQICKHIFNKWIDSEISITKMLQYHGTDCQANEAIY